MQVNNSKEDENKPPIKRSESKPEEGNNVVPSSQQDRGEPSSSQGR